MYTIKILFEVHKMNNDIYFVEYRHVFIPGETVTALSS